MSARRCCRNAVNLRKKARKPLDAKAAREVITDYLTWQVIVNGGESILEALDLEARYQISFWEALVLQAAHASGADVLYSEDFSDRPVYGSVRIVNPLVNRPDPPAGSRAVRLPKSDD